MSNAAPKKIVAAKYRAMKDAESGQYGVYMFCPDEENDEYEDNGSLVSLREWKEYDKAEASAKKWQEKEDKSVAKENKRLGF